jgi:undecaprenyl-diphosphatase
MPGISRSGSTLAAGMIMGLKKETAMDFSFIMSIPVILGSAVLGVKDLIESPVTPDFLVLIIGMIAAGFSGYFAVKFMLDFFKKHSLVWFSIYVAVAGLFVLIDQLFIHNFFDYFIVWNMA